MKVYDSVFPLHFRIPNILFINPFAGVNALIQILKSGELVCLPVPTHATATSQVN